jgi:hypothetical protein
MVDGPPFMGDRKWSKKEFEMLRRCGITPKGLCSTVQYYVGARKGMEAV